MMASSVIDQDVAAVRGVLAAQVAAMRARDAEGLVRQFTPDAVTCTLAPPLWNPAPVVRDVAALRAWMDTFDGPIDYENRELGVEVGGDVAFAYGVSRLSATPRGGKEGFDLWFRFTVGLRRVDGEWLIAHEHRSVPFYMDGSFRACVDLRP
jgi:ketosteroid isomerase-like protein